MATGDPDFSLPVARSMACRRWWKVVPPEFIDFETTYRTAPAGSITGVPVTPTSGAISPPGPKPTRKLAFPLGTVVSPAVAPCPVSMRLTFHSCVQGLASASKAYRLSCWVATNTTLWTAPLTLRLATHSGCAYTAPSTVQEKSLPKLPVFTFAGASAYSCVLAPSRSRSLWYVYTPGKSVTPTVADALRVASVTLVAVRV